MNELHEARVALADSTRRATPIFKNGKRVGTVGEKENHAKQVPDSSDRPIARCRPHGASACVPCARDALACQAERDRPAEVVTMSPAWRPGGAK
jgi:hypothetical protein